MKELGANFLRDRKSIRAQFANNFRRVLVRNSRELTAEMLQQPAVVFSPHQDDETLGCGGTIIKKIEAGAEVWIVFMTDGHQSHQHLMTPEKLAGIRRFEAVSACTILGVPEEKVFFLDFPDGGLFGFIEQAAVCVQGLLADLPAVEIFVPYRDEPTDDHIATHVIIEKALTGQKRSYTVYEYPVWFWHHWPWVTLFQSDMHNRLFVLKNSFRAWFGLAFFSFRSRVAVAAVQEQKRAALNAHASQMTQLLDDPAWLTLHDVSDGEFLNNSLQDYELFYRYVYSGADKV